MAHALTRDAMLSSGKVYGVTTGFTGVMMIMGPDARSGTGANTIAPITVLRAADAKASPASGGASANCRPRVVALGRHLFDFADGAPWRSLALAPTDPWLVSDPGFSRRRRPGRAGGAQQRPRRRPLVLNPRHHRSRRTNSTGEISFCFRAKLSLGLEKSGL